MNTTITSLRFARVAMLIAGLVGATIARADEVFIGGPETADAGVPGTYFNPNAPHFNPGPAPMSMQMPAPMPVQVQTLMPAPMPVNVGVPLLGFTGDACGWGVHVRSVNWGSVAQRIGLEPGDVIVGLNGRPVRSLNDYYRALQQSGGVVALEVRDVRTGNLVTTVPYNVFQSTSNGVACAAPQMGY